MEKTTEKPITPIFIISLPRSGSTLLQNLLSNNNSVATSSEPWILIPLLSFIKGDYKSKTNAYLAKDAVNEFLISTTKNDIKETIKKTANHLYSQNINKNNKFFLDKTPRYYEYANEIIELFPQAKIIVLKRDLCDVLNSIIHTWKIDDIYKMRSFKRDLLDAPIILQNFSEKQSQNPNVITIHYEDLIKNSEFTINKLYTWLGIEYTSKVLDFSLNKKTEGKFGDPIGVKKNKQPININKNRNILTDSYWRKFTIGYLNYLGKSFLNEYGYSDYPTLKRTIDFNLFIYSCFSKRSNNRTALLNIIKNIWFQIRCKKYLKPKINQDINILM